MVSLFLSLSRFFSLSVWRLSLCLIFWLHFHSSLAITNSQKSLLSFSLCVIIAAIYFFLSPSFSHSIPEFDSVFSLKWILIHCIIQLTARFCAVCTLCGLCVESWLFTLHCVECWVLYVSLSVDDWLTDSLYTVHCTLYTVHFMCVCENRGNKWQGRVRGAISDFSLCRSQLLNSLAELLLILLHLLLLLLLLLLLFQRNTIARTIQVCIIWLMLPVPCVLLTHN